jgi:Mg2+/citrate symporter
MKTKKWLKSKTIWANAAALGFLLGFAAFGMVMPSEWMGSSMVALNILLRFVTKDRLGKEDDEEESTDTDSSSSTENMEKPWWKSRTIWVNIIALVLLLVSKATGFEIPIEAEATLLSVINVIMRSITGSGIDRKSITLPVKRKQRVESRRK